MSSGVVYKTEYLKANEQSKPKGNSFVHALILIWMVGVIMLDKYFAYISVGPIYITEVVLVSMILTNLRQITAADIFLIGVVLFYFAGGVMLGHDIFFSIRDLAWLYYLLFLRFFPRDFPRKYIDIIVSVCWIHVVVIVISPLLGPYSVYFVHKYRDGVVTIFLAAYLSLINPRGRPSAFSIIVLCAISYLTDYKTLMLIMFMLPLLLSLRGAFSKWHSPKRLGISVAVILAIIYNGGAKSLLNSGVDTLNFILSSFGVSKSYSTSTAEWRAEIWTTALLKLTSWTSIMFGEFPGHNFMNSKFLGIKSFLLSGGESLGIVRTAHNILVQMVMKTGIIGLIVYGWYYFRTADTKSTTIKIFRILALSLAMTADILEVPSRGPLLFSFFVILELRFLDESPHLNHSLETQAINIQHALTNKVQ